jgi:aminopeptidase-like protein
VNSKSVQIGQLMHEFATQIFPFNRSLTGDGVRETLESIKRKVSGLKIREFKSGQKIYDWQIPNEWKVNYAHLIDPDGNKICDFFDNNLHLVGYSISIDKKMSLQELLPFLHTIPEQPTAIPYITSYYEERWGFCLSENDKKSLKDGFYEVKVSTTAKPGKLLIGEIYIPGKTNKEVFISTYTCHPSMANNEVSGITVATFLASFIKDELKNYYSYRLVFLPETIGSLIYIKKN